METKSALTVMAVAMMAGAASADVRMDLMFSTDGGLNWQSEVSVLEGSAVRVGLFVTHDSYDFAGATLRLTGSGLSAGDALAFTAGTDQGVVTPYQRGADGNAIYRTGSTFRIDSATDAGDAGASSGIQMALAGPDSGGPVSLRNPFLFDIVIGAGGVRDIVLMIDQLNRGVCSLFDSANATRPLSSAATLDGGTIHVVPAPATVAMVATIGLRRRRR